MSYYVKVTNHNDFPIDDHFDGVHYIFEPNKSVKLPFDAACHIFGIEHPDQVSSNKDELLNFVCRRWGWNTPDILKDKQHLERFKKIKLALVSYKMVEDDDKEDDQGLPASRVESSDQPPVRSRMTLDHSADVDRPARGRRPQKQAEELIEDSSSNDESADDEEAA